MMSQLSLSKSAKTVTAHALQKLR